MGSFFEGGAKSLSFGEVGSDAAKAVFGKWRGGLVVNIGEARQQTDWNDRTTLKTWPNGDPIMQLPITLDTWEGGAGKCPEPAIDEEDDGVRDQYITKGKQEFQAARNALKKAGAADFAVGGHLYTRWFKGEGKQGDPRQFEMVYEPPAQTSAGFLADEPGPAAPAQPSMPPQVSPAQPSGAFSGGQAAGFPGPDSVAEVQQPRFDPQTGQPLAPAPAAAQLEPPRFDPQTGEPLNQAAADILARSAPAQQPTPAANGWSPGQQTAPAGPGPQAGAQGVTNPYRR